MKKVLRIINRFNIGGPTYNVAYLTKYLGNNFETILVGGAIDDTEDSSDFILNKLGLEPIVIPEMKREINLKQDRIAYKKIKDLIKLHKPDIVHTHASKAGALGRMAAHSMNVPQIYHTFHGHVFHSYFGKVKTEFYKTVERRLAKKSTKIIAISERQKYELSEIHKICSKDKIEVIPLGFALTRFTEDKEIKRKKFRDKWQIKENEFAIGIIGRLVPIKNHHLFLDAMKIVQEKSNKVLKLLIVGDGELCEELKLYARTLGLDNVVFTSWIKEIDVVMHGLDLVCLTSRNEGTPVSLIEAQAAGVPLVTTNVGGVENIVLSNKSGTLVNNHEADYFAEAVLKLIDSPELLKLYKQSGAHVLENYNYQRLCENMRKLYENH